MDGITTARTRGSQYKPIGTNINDVPIERGNAE